MTSAVRHVTVASRDPYALAAFWAQVVGGRLQDDDAPGDPEALVTSAGPPLLFVRVEDLGSAGRTHLDLQPSATRELEVERLLALGATVHPELNDLGWYAYSVPPPAGPDADPVVLVDPDGHEFCVGPRP